MSQHARPESKIVTEPCCPRCGYDQRGLIATWTDQCPLEGLCSECGYAFSWSDVMRPDRLLLAGYFEHTRGLWACVVAAWRTLAWVVVPFVYWSKVKMHHEVRPRRLVLWPIVVIAMLWFLIGVIRSASYYIDGRQTGMSFREVAIDLSNSFIFPIIHAEPTTWVMTNTGPTRLNRLSVDFVMLNWSPVFWGVIGQAILFPALLLALPVTRQRAKIRKRHVLRAAVFSQSWVMLHLSLFLVSAIIGVARSDWNIALCWDGPVLNFLHDHRGLYGLVLVSWMAVWWWLALEVGMKLPQATRHWFLLMLAALLMFCIFAVSDWRFSAFLA